MENLKEIMAGLVYVYNNYLHKTKKIEWQSDEQKGQLQQVIDVIHPGATVDYSCEYCITNALAIVLCRYEAMYPKENIRTRKNSKKSKA